MGFDKAITYFSRVANRYMTQCTNTSLNTNPHYASVDVGETKENIPKKGLRELVNFLKEKCAFRDVAVAAFLDAKHTNCLLVPAFGANIVEGELLQRS